MHGGEEGDGEMLKTGVNIEKNTQCFKFFTL